MNDEYLLEKGYKKYPPTKFNSDLTVAMFQKRFDDNTGKKYFINVIKNSWGFVPASRRDKWWTPFTYEYEVQVTKFEEEKALNLNFFSSWSLDEVEKFMEEFFNKMNPNYYETWDEC